MYMMSLCDSNIIANSSFGWWGAWLNSKKVKTVIAPKEYFDKKYCKIHNIDTKDVYPENWKVIDA